MAAVCKLAQWDVLPTFILSPINLELIALLQEIQRRTFPEEVYLSSSEPSQASFSSSAKQAFSVGWGSQAHGAGLGV